MCNNTNSINIFSVSFPSIKSHIWSNKAHKSDLAKWWERWRVDSMKKFYEQAKKILPQVWFIWDTQEQDLTQAVKIN